MSLSRRLAAYLLKEKSKISLGILATVIMGLTEVFTGAFFKVLTDALTSMSKLKKSGLMEIPVSLKIPSPFHTKKIKILDTVFTGPDEIFRGLLMVGLVFLTIYTVKTVFLYLREVFMNSAAERILQNFKQDIYRKILHLPMAFLNRNQTGDLVSRVTYDVTTLKEFINLLIELSRSVSYIVIFLPVLFYINWRITLFALVFFPCAIWIIRTLTVRIKHYSKELTDNVGDYTAFLEEKINMAGTVKMYGRETEEKQVFYDLVEKNYQINLKLILTKYLLKPSNEWLGIFSTVLVFIFFSWHMTKNSGTGFGDIAFYLYLLKNTYKPVKKVAESLGPLQIALVSTRKIFRLLDEQEEVISDVIEDKNGQLQSSVNSLELKNITFAYHSDSPVLSNLSLHAEKGEIVGITGESGQGKTTILNLIKGFYTPDKGEILVNGQNVSQWSLKALRSIMAEANSEQTLMTGTLLDNIRYGSEWVSEREISPYLNFLGLNQDDLSRVIQSSRPMMSTGQKHKIMIVRALLRQPKILLLDEVFSSVDTESVDLLFEFLKTPDITLLTTRNPEILKRTDRVVAVKRYV